MLISSGKVLRIEKTSIHDGDGLRTVVFLKGCHLKCKWCSTPESQKECITEGYGIEMTADEVVKEICKDEIFFFHSGGGVTISGGEVLMQADFTQEILRRSQKHGIATAIETSFFADFKEIEKLLPYLTSIYVDFKIFDEDRHIFYTGVSNQKIKDNLKKLDQVYRGKIYIRIPTVPTVNMTEDNMRKTAEFLSQLNHTRNVELLPYHRLGLNTYHRLNRVYELNGIEIPSMEDMQRMTEVFKEVNPEFTMKIKGELFEEN
ncbi:glycyl-radical enzyme activating protein [Clostridium tyrobutyricum]|uniref:glycyl-radical enzyme activating protein n=1 Tax=Clostridium tyrobutyricum TaxID=1519 RepID=UPI0002D441BB|nr:glycyl-radical enzyme activating protein [Clostridium tyrobutyricum]